MSSQRDNQRRQWLESVLPGADPPEPASADASFRSYWRTRQDGQSYIIMDAPPDKEPLGPFINVARLLEQSDVRVPAIRAQSHEAGFLLLEDLGNTQAAAELGQSPGQTRQIYDNAAALLVQLARVPPQSLPAYSAAKLREELDLFTAWACAEQKVMDGPKEWDAMCEALIDGVLVQPTGFVHRDFHCGNLMLLGDGDLAVLDFQDAVRGPVTYDLASLIWDRYLHWNRDEIVAFAERIRQAVLPDADPATWLRWVDLMGLQRNLKVVGIFARLALRDGKHHYLSWQPRFAQYVIDTASRYDFSRGLAAFMEPFARDSGS